MLPVSMLLMISLCFSGEVNSHSIEFKRIYFLDGRPRKDESINDLPEILDKKQLSVLGQILEALKERPDIGVKVLGFADRNECAPSDCLDLSLRRARIVVDWLLSHGLPSVQLKGPEGMSTSWPLYKDATKEERIFNRRVDFEPYLLIER